MAKPSAKAGVLNANALGMAFGAVAAVGHALLSWAASWTGWALPLVALRETAFLGADASFLGGLVAALWAFVLAYAGGYAIAWAYNRSA